MPRLAWLSLVSLAGIVGVSACGIGVVGEADPTTPTPTPDAGSDAASVDSAAPDAGVDAAVDAGTDAGPYPTRAKTGLLAFYDFEENAGTTVKDAIAPAADLAFVGDNLNTIWKPHGLLLEDDTRLETAAAVDKIRTSYVAKKELTVEVWVIPSKTSAQDYGRLVTMASSPSNRSFALGSYQSNVFWASMYNGEDLQPDTPENAVQKKLTHLVMTRETTGVLRLYVDGKPTGLLPGVGDPADFETYKLGVGNIPGGTNRSFGGEVHLLAIYDHALTDAERALNDAAGADP